MNIIILGSNGMLGSMLSFLAKKKNKNIICLTRKDFDAEKDNITKLSVYIKQPCCVVNCIGAIPQKNYSENSYTKLNTELPLKLSEFCKMYSVPLIHVSTNCVFSGKEADCLESNIPDAIDLYGLSKYQGEPEDCTVIRCSIIGPERNTSFGLMEWFLSKEGTVNGYTDHYWNGLTTLELSNAILTIINENKFINGIQHLYSQNTVSKFELLQIISERSSSKCKILPISAGIKHYTLKSTINSPRILLEQQLTDLFNILNAYRYYYAL